MLAFNKSWNVSSISFPVLATPKLDGIRVLKYGGRVQTRTGKPLPNLYVQSLLEKYLPDNIDGEVITVAQNYTPDAYNDVQSKLMSELGEPRFMYYAFDIIEVCTRYSDRMIALEKLEIHDNINWTKLLPKTINNEEELLKHEEHIVSSGYEGLILRSPNGPYKFGRSTFREGYMLKFCRWERREAIVEGMEFKNINLDTSSKKQENLITDTTKMGALLCRDTVNPDWCIRVGSGFTHMQQEDIARRFNEGFKGRILTYKYKPHGTLELPRQPIFVGWRDSIV